MIEKIEIPANIIKMLKYIQLLQNYTITLKNKKVTLKKETILPVYHKNLGKRFYTKKSEILHVSYLGDHFSLAGKTKYRWLSNTENKLYQQPVTIVEKFKMIPIIDIPKKIIPIDTNTKIGAVVYIDGFTFDKASNRYIPYAEYNKIRYKLNWDSFIPTVAFVSLFKQSPSSYLPLNIEKKLLG